MNINRLKILLAFNIFLLIFTLHSSQTFAHTAQSHVSEVKIWHVAGNIRHPVRTGLSIQNEVEQVLDSVQEMDGISFIYLPAEYYILRFSTPVILFSSPIGYPISEAVITFPENRWDRYKLLIKNPQNQWVEYHTSRSLATLVHQLKARE
ncbi:hypothetical protein ACFO25_08245 [Paenactinomyces guangxiensis]|uniref:Uncharacterized protein n=1 Tax=Paenactinomyces guangxiensis TaxID=1490290 RepID=A0A7W1WN59_9BACL|nr:hypothetical protein [Paenactinomyces guangxiensis]MBA4492966.1 hypothetical protein [Paenactinomyces guangxiensis]MBH8590185.1 hypothetical protein [Paenactinomyces guangxiensis]